MEQFSNFFGILLSIMLGCVIVAGLGLILIARHIRNLNVPPDADYFTTMRYVPLLFVILLDLLDFGMDILAAPVVWLALDRMGLRGLRNKAAAEALIPFTQPIPTFTISWIAARVLDLGERPWRPYDTGLERR